MDYFPCCDLAVGAIGESAEVNGWLILSEPESIAHYIETLAINFEDKALRI